MQIYSILEPARGPVRPDDPRSVIFLKEGFCWPALFVPLLWMLYHRMWLVAGAYIGMSALVALLGQLLGTQETPAAIIGLGFGLIIAFEAAGIRRWHLLRNGYRQVASVAAKNLPLAEARYFAEKPEANTPGLPLRQSASAASEKQRAVTGWGFMAPDAQR